MVAEQRSCVLTANTSQMELIQQLHYGSDEGSMHCVLVSIIEPH